MAHHLVQILLPLSDNGGQAFPPEAYQRVRRELTEKFGGLTVYARAPAQGLWKGGTEQITRDDIVVFEVMAARIDAAWWSGYKTTLQERFAQEEIIVRAQQLRLL